jgi:hypothetical protein
LWGCLKITDAAINALALNCPKLEGLDVEVRTATVKRDGTFPSGFYSALLPPSLLIISIVALNSELIQFLNPNLKITSEVSKTIILTSLCGFIYVIYLANTHLLTWFNKFWVLGISTQLEVIFQVIVIYLSIDSFGYLSAALGLGSALTLQILLLQIARSRTESRNAIKPIWQIIPLVIFWAVAVLFLQ